jgi:Holliday junction resolvase-like predicted endonuclease
MQDITIHVLGRDNNKIGDHLEILAKELLAKLGFGSFIRNAYKTGAEIDLRARHRVTDAPLMCECKARSEKMGTHEVKLFYAEWEKEHKADNRLHGITISTSGYTGTAEQWYVFVNRK